LSPARSSRIRLVTSGCGRITGEALLTWERLRDDPALLAEALREAHARLSLLVNGGTAAEPDTTDQVRVVSPELPSTEPVAVVTKEAARAAEQKEAVLRESFRKWRDPRGNRLKGIEIKTASSPLRVDLYDPLVNVLIEAKGH